MDIEQYSEVDMGEDHNMKMPGEESSQDNYAENKIKKDDSLDR